MMKLIQYLILLLVTAFIISCKKDNAPSTEAPGFSCLIDGAAWSADESKESTHAIFGSNENNSLTYGSIWLKAIAADGTILSIQIQDTLPGYYPFAKLNSILGGVYQTMNPYQFYQQWLSSDTSGFVNVTEIDKLNKTISGEFSFSVASYGGLNQKTISNGSFNKIKYDVPADPFITALDNGNEFNYSNGNVKPWLDFDPYSLNLIGTYGSSFSTSISFKFPPDITAGNYDVANSSIEISYQATSFGPYLSPVSGLMTINEHDVLRQVIKGSFEMQVNFPGDTSHLTNGTFETVYR